jgi:translocation and assembly module TamA
MKNLRTVPCTVTGIPAFLSAIDLKVTVEGIEGDVKNNVLAYLSIEKQKAHEDLTPVIAQILHRKAPEEIRTALQPYGYYNPVINDKLIHENSAWHAMYTISVGAPVIIDTIDIAVTGEGAEDTVFASLEEALPVKKGDVLSHQYFEDSKRMLHNRAARAGYLKAEMISARVNVYPEKNRAEIVLHFKTGSRYYFGTVSFVQDSFSADFLSRFVRFSAGDIYSTSALMELQKDLNNSDYFSSVEIMPKIDESEDFQVPIEVRVKSRKRNQYTFGLGYGTDTGARASLGWENRRVTRNGHRFKANLRISGIKTSISSEYTIPLTKPLSDHIVLSAGWLNEDTKTSNTDKTFGGVHYNYLEGEWKKSIYATYEKDDFDVGNESGQSTLFIPGMSWTRIRADNPVTVRQGSRVYLDIRGAHDALLSDATFAQFRMQAKYIRGITAQSRFIARCEAGASLIDNFSDLPPSVRFFAGGDNSIRGYAYNSLGPKDGEGYVIGGKHLLVGSIEFEHLIRDKWSAAVFYDAGNAIDALSDPIKNGAGFGIRWQSPVGPVRLDLGFPLDTSDSSWRIHFVIGPDL